MPPDDPEQESLDSETEETIRVVVREELARQQADSPLRVIGQVLAGVLFALFVLQPILGVSLFAFAEAGVPMPLLVAAPIVLFLGLIAYGWRLPPFR